jgi:hypothetical protein
MDMCDAGDRERPAEKMWEGLGYGFERLEEGLIGFGICDDGLLLSLCLLETL